MDFPFGRPFEHHHRREEEQPAYPPPPPLPTHHETHNPYRADSDVNQVHHETHNPFRPDSDVYQFHHETHNPLRDDLNAIHIHHAVDVPHHRDQYYPPPETRSFSPPPPPPPPPETRSFSPPPPPETRSFSPPPPPETRSFSPPPPPPPPEIRSFSPPPPPPRHVHHEHSGPYLPPPPFSSNVQHVAHETHVRFPGPGPFPIHNSPWPDHSVVLPIGEDVRVFCEAETDYSLTLRDGSAVLARCNPRDEFQHWIKDETYSTKVKDQEGFPAFALVNKATGQALQHSTAATQPVRLKPYHPNECDESILWTKSKDLGHGFRAIRMVNNIRLNLDAFNGDKNHGGVHDGTKMVLWEWKKGENQRWKLVPYCKEWDLKISLHHHRNLKSINFNSMKRFLFLLNFASHYCQHL